MTQRRYHAMHNPYDWKHTAGHKVLINHGCDWSTVQPPKPKLHYDVANRQRTWHSIAIIDIEVVPHNRTNPLKFPQNVSTCGQYVDHGPSILAIAFQPTPTFHLPRNERTYIFIDRYYNVEQNIRWNCVYSRWAYFYGYLFHGQHKYRVRLQIRTIPTKIKPPHLPFRPHPFLTPKCQIKLANTNNFGAAVASAPKHCSELT